MKRFFAVASLLLVSGSLYAVGAVWSSSHTATADSGKSLCGVNNKRRALLHAVCVNDGPSGTITLFDSVATTLSTSTIAVIRSTSAVSAGCSTFDIATSSGLTYTTSAANDVTFSYSCY